MAEGIYKRGDSWAIVINVGVDPVTGKRKQKWVTVKGTKKDAERERTRLLRERDTGQVIADPGRQTVAQYLRHWLRTYVATNCRPKSQVCYEFKMERYIIPLVGAVPLAKLTPAHIREAYAKLYTVGATGRPLSARSLQVTHAILHRALKHAVEWQMVGRNVADNAKPPRPTPHEMQVWTVEQVQRFLNATDTVATPYGACMALALWTGMRQAELIGLRWQDVDLERGNLRVVKIIQHVNKRGTVEGEPKTASGRRGIALSGSAIEILRRHKIRQNEARLRAGAAYEDRGLVFANALGGSITAARLRQVFWATVKALGLPRISFHGLRHTHASLLLAENVHPKIVSERLGHSNVGITLNTYSHLLPGLQDAAAGKLDRLLQQPVPRADASEG